MVEIKNVDYSCSKILYVIFFTFRIKSSSAIRKLIKENMKIKKRDMCTQLAYAENEKI